MKHAVKTFNKEGKLVYENFHKTVETAYEEYVKNIAIAKKYCRKGEEITIARFNDGQVMTFETVVGAN